MLIGMGGFKESGKDTVADFLVERYGYVKMGMSDALNEVLMIQNPIVAIEALSWDKIGVVRYADVIEEFGYNEAKKRVEEVRRLLKVTGTEVGRELMDEDVWVDKMSQKISALGEGADVVVTGIRFPNELRMVEAFSGYSVWVDRPEKQVGDTHASETSVQASDFEFRIDNTGTLDDLSEMTDSLMIGVRDLRPGRVIKPA